jgi:TonB family protein
VLVHFLVLLALRVTPVGPGAPAVTYVEVSVATEEEMEEIELPEEQSPEESARARMEARLANLVADQRAEASDDRRSSAADAKLSRAEEAEIERSVRSYAAGLRGEGRGGAEADEEEPEEGEAMRTRGKGPEPRLLPTFEGWNKRYSGPVTVGFDLAGRQAVDLDVPGYRCRGGGEVVVEVVVRRSGEVVSAKVVRAPADPCFAEEALRSARRSRFNADAQAPKEAVGRITYVFQRQ